VHKHKIEVRNMPGRDGTGPWGAGSMTGRGAGYCAVYLEPTYAYPVRAYGRGFRIGGGRGYGRGWGRGFGRGWCAYPLIAVPPASPQAYSPTTQPQLPEQEVAALENYQKNLAAEKADLEQEMDGVKDRIEELKAKTSQ
jgi:hypothetical protein